MAVTVGCASHQFSITDRGGGVVLSNGNLINVEYNRVLNDASTASVKIEASDECCDALGQVRAWRHTLNIYRDGEFMWSGFVLNVDWTETGVDIVATDLVGLLDRRVPHADYTFNGTDLSVIAETLIDDALRPDDPGHEVTVVELSGVAGGRTYEENIGQTADHLRDLADTGIDFTALGTNLIILPDRFCELIGSLSDADLPDGLTVTEDGASLVTRQIVAGAEDVIGVAGGVNEYYGLLEVYIEQTSITDQTSADAAARARLRESARVPVFIDTKSVTLASSAPVAVSSLVPGWCVDVTTTVTCRPVTQRLKITGLQVTEDGGTSDTPGQERVVLQLTATGQPMATEVI